MRTRSAQTQSAQPQTAQAQSDYSRLLVLTFAINAFIWLGLDLVWPVGLRFVRYLAMVPLAVITCDFLRYRLRPGSREWVYWDDYLLNQVLPALGPGIFVAVGQRMVELMASLGPVTGYLVTGPLAASLVAVQQRAERDQRRATARSRRWFEAGQ